MPDWPRFVRDHLPADGLKREREEEIIAELAQQLEDFYQEALAGGASEAEADEYARRQVPDWEILVPSILAGSPGCREAAIDRWCEKADVAASARETQSNLPARLLADLRHDLLHGIRILLKNRGFTATALITLAFGIGINTAVFSVVNAIISTPQQYPNAETLVVLWSTKNPDIRHGRVSAADALDIESRAGSFSEFGVFRSTAKAWRGAAEAERVRTLEATASLFSMIGVGPGLGRLLPVREDAAAGPVVVVTDNFWRAKLGADPGIIGKTYALEGVHHTVIGVLEPTRKLMQLAHFDVDLLTPLPRDAARENRGERSYRVLARLKPGILPVTAQAELDGIAAALARAHPETNADRGIRLEALADRLVRPDDRLGGLGLMVAVTAVLLIACINLAHMLIAKATHRTREFAIRLALGAGRMRIVRQLLTESLLLALAGGLLGLWLADGMLRLTLRSMEDWPITMQDLGLNFAVLLYALCISLATSAAFGLAPAALLSRIPVADAIKETWSTRVAGLSRNRLRQALVVTELAIGLPLLICCGLAVRNLQGLGTIELGFEPRNLVTMYVELPQFRYPEKAQWPAVFQAIIARMQALPGVQAAGASLSFPVGGAHHRLLVRARVEGGPKSGEEPSEYLHCLPVTQGYFEAMKIPLLSGRRFGEHDGAGSPQVAMINRRMALSYFQNMEAVGRTMTLDPGTAEERPVTIVGIVGDS
ncbi:MAG: FtsX-like permease family protein, partial [Acidobacteria bacterium]|nr:FtsX-like permease family protein [Acidobacteriota bacterium]